MHLNKDSGYVCLYVILVVYCLFLSLLFRLFVFVLFLFVSSFILIFNFNSLIDRLTGWLAGRLFNCSIGRLIALLLY